MNRVRVGIEPFTFDEGISCQIWMRGAIVNRDGHATTHEFPIEEIAHEAKRLFHEAAGHLDDDVMAIYGTAPLLFGLFMNLARVTLSLSNVPVSQTQLTGALRVWQNRSGLKQRLRSWAHHGLLTGTRLAEALTTRDRPLPGPGAKWLFLWALSKHNNQSLAILRAECEERGDTVLDINTVIELGPKNWVRGVTPEPWGGRSHNLWRYRQMPLAIAVARANRLADALVKWGRAEMGLELDAHFLSRSVVYDLVLGDALEKILARVQPEVFVCPMNSPGYLAAHRANVRCVEFTGLSADEALTQKTIPKPREIVGLEKRELDWIENLTGQRCIATLESDPATEAVRVRMAAARNRTQDEPLRVVYFPTYAATICGYSEETRIKEDAIVRTVVANTPEIKWLIKPHPSDEYGAARFSWVREVPWVELHDRQVAALELVQRVDAVIHCGSSIAKPLGQLGIPQIEIALEGRMLSTPTTFLTDTAIVVKDASQAVEALRSLPKTKDSRAAVSPVSVRDLLLS